VATYPSFGQMVGSTSQIIDDIIVDRARGGGAKVRSLYSARKTQFRLLHRLDASEITTLMTFYDTNRLLAVDLVWSGDGLTYSCVFSGAPQINFDTPQWAAAMVMLEQV
jgi:hypothetical protein